MSMLGAVSDLLDFLLKVRRRLLSEVRHVVALTLQLRYGGHQLGHGGRDVGELDDHPLGSLGQLPQPGEVVFLPLLCRQVVRKGREDSSRDGDVSLLNVDPHRPREPLEHRQEGEGRQHRGLVRDSVDNFGHFLLKIKLMSFSDVLVETFGTTKSQIM